jgi:hypothetical protein
MGSTPRMSRHVRDRYAGSLDNLVAAGDLVRGLMAHPGWSHLMGIIDAETNVIDRKLDGAIDQPLSQAEYSAAHGRRGGLRAIEDAAHAIVSVADDELEKQRALHEGAGETALEAT